jgi:hypothetical protein
MCVKIKPILRAIAAARTRDSRRHGG